jgi:hypothetical protein
MRDDDDDDVRVDSLLTGTVQGQHKRRRQQMETATERGENRKKNNWYS